MYKKIIPAVILVIAILGTAYWLKNKYTHSQNASQTTSQTTAVDFDEQTFTYNLSSLPEKCQLNSEMACAVELAVKCTINPEFNGCKDAGLPKFIFMNDPSLQRPSQMSFKISKIKPIAADLVEIHTQSTCNGNWFGLCNGNIIYVLVPNGESWRVKDIYAIEL